jgi:hypothetical protein
MPDFKTLFSLNRPGFAYHLINFLFVGVIFSVILYSFVYSENNHPIPSIFTEFTGETSPSKGLSAGFSSIVRGDFSKALDQNAYSLRIFSFFAIQLLLRFFCSIIIYVQPERLRKIALLDTFFSIVIFSWCFAPLIEYTISLMSKLF